MISWGQLKQELLHKAAVHGTPVTGTFELTARCNLRCVMCYICRGAASDNARTSELSAAQWLDLARQARDAGMLYVLFTGGEVFLREDFQQIYEGVVDLGMIPSIYSNGSLLTENDIQWLAKRPPELVSITLYGTTSEMYDRVCGSGDAFNRVVRNIDALLAEGLNLELSTTVTTENACQYEALMEFSKSRGIPLKFCFYLSPTHVDCQGKAIASYRLQPEQLVPYMERAELGYRNHIEQLFAQNPKESAPNEKVREECSLSGYREGSAFPCLAGRNNVWLSWDGRMTVCSLSREPASRPLQVGFEKGLQDLQAKMQTVSVCEECNSCNLQQFCIACPVTLMNETGSHQKPAEYLCKIAKLRKNAPNAS